SYVRDNLKELDECDGLILTGGHDVDPRMYGAPQGHPKVVEVDQQRDTFERKALEQALNGGIPVLGVCRGLQVANVHFGGTLIQDLRESGRVIHEGAPLTAPGHTIDVMKESGLERITGCQQGLVNTSHHQAALEVGTGLKITARAADGVCE